MAICLEHSDSLKKFRLNQEFEKSLGALMEFRPLSPDIHLKIPKDDSNFFSYEQDLYDQYKTAFPLNHLHIATFFSKHQSTFQQFFSFFPQFDLENSEKYKNWIRLVANSVNHFEEEEDDDYSEIFPSYPCTCDIFYLQQYLPKFFILIYYCHGIRYFCEKQELTNCSIIYKLSQFIINDIFQYNRETALQHPYPYRILQSLVLHECVCFCEEHSKVLSFMDESIILDPIFAMYYNNRSVAHSISHHISSAYKDTKKFQELINVVQEYPYGLLECAVAAIAVHRPKEAYLHLCQYISILQDGEREALITEEDENFSHAYIAWSELMWLHFNEPYLAMKSLKEYQEIEFDSVFSYLECNYVYSMQESGAKDFLLDDLDTLQELICNIPF